MPSTSLPGNEIRIFASVEDNDNEGIQHVP